jgi:hypothetical protein
MDVEPVLRVAAFTHSMHFGRGMNQMHQVGGEVLEPISGDDAGERKLGRSTGKRDCVPGARWRPARADRLGRDDVESMLLPLHGRKDFALLPGAHSALIDA